MFVSIILSIYKDIEALKLIIDALSKQTYKNFELIVSEDNNSIEIKKYLESIETPFKIKHISQEDIGVRKSLALNKSILIAEGEYVIFLDGDCVPFTTFVDAHVKISEPNRYLCGRRVNLGLKISSALRDKKLIASNLEKNSLKNWFTLLNDNSEHVEQFFYFKPNGIINKLFDKLNNNLHILGANFSCFKKDLIKINGVDTSIPGELVSIDTDIEWRLEFIGVKPKTVKICANVFHLYHKIDNSARKKVYDSVMKIVEDRKQNNEYIAQKGIAQID